MSAGFHNQSPLLTMLYVRITHAKVEKYIDIIFSLNGDQESTNLRLTYLDINKADQEAIFELKKTVTFKMRLVTKPFW